MGLVKITFDGSTVSSKQDADLNHHLSGLVPAGIVKGLGGELSISVSNNRITFSDGYVQIYGRRIYVESGSYVNISLDSTKYGYAIITVNLTSNTATLTSVETSSSSYPTLTQQDLSASGKIYQFPVAKYKKTTTSLTLDSSFQRTFINPAKQVADEALEKANSLGLKRKYKYASFYDMSDYISVYSADVDISDFPYGSVVVITFSTGDPWGYGALPNNFATLVYNRDDLMYSFTKTQIRNSENTGWINVTLSAGYDDILTISFDDGVSGIPFEATIYCYYV